MAGYRSTKFWAVERVDGGQWRVSVQGRDRDGAEQCRQFLRGDYRTAIQDAAEVAKSLGLQK
jgi:hypothetical protein